ncbi:MAG: hypothetical protein JNK02_09215 [Planctomycetes bacterium]|nr:hypothetical protein [Planctomycetota bacterium]
MRPSPSALRSGFRGASFAAAPLLLVQLAPSAAAQAVPVTFSIDWLSPSRALIPANHGDVLAPAAAGLPAFGALPAVVAIPGGPVGAGLGIPSFALPCAGPPGLGPCPTEIDALSYGVDFPVRPGPTPAHTFEFSVDEFALGFPGTPLAPNVLAEAPCGDSAADVFADLGLPGAPMPILPGGNTGVVDGNGLASCSGALYPGFGLVEPNFPLPFGIPDGDDVDAYDAADGPMPAAFPVYFSLDAAWPDPLTGLPNTGSGPANGFAPGAVLVTLAPGGPPVVYAPAGALGLDLVAFGVDDLDALALAENGIPGYQPAPGPYLWGPGTPFDMLLFSVRRGSFVIGLPDSLTGIPICEGDILIPPVVGGLSPFPGIFVPAERLGLATARSLGIPFSAELDGLDTRWRPQTATGYCFGDTAAACPCGNAGAAGNGCANSIFAAGANLTASGNAQVSADSVVLTGTNMPNSSVLYFQGTTQVQAVFGDGLRCVAGAVIRLSIKSNVGNTSSFPVGIDPPLSVAGLIPAAGGTRHYQGWYRDAAPFCTPATFNLTNGITITWTP